MTDFSSPSSVAAAGKIRRSPLPPPRPSPSSISSVVMMDTIPENCVPGDSRIQVHQEKKDEEPLISTESEANLLDGEPIEEKLYYDGGLACDIVSKDSSDVSSPQNSSTGSPVLRSPTWTVSPIVINNRKRFRTSSTSSTSQKDLTKEVQLSIEDLLLSFDQPSEHLAASLQRGLQIIDSDCQSSAFRTSLLDFKEENYNSNLQLVAVEVSQSAEKQVPKAVENVLVGGAIRREFTLEEFCAKQTAMMHLNGMVEQYTHERECFEEERRCWTDSKSKWITLCEELRIELEENRSLAQKQRLELDSENRCSEELIKKAMQTAMQGHERIIEQFSDLQENYLALLARQQKIQEGTEDVRKAAVKAGVKVAESKFINSLVAEISALKVEREKARQYLMDVQKGIQAQLRDTAYAVQAAGELLVRLKEAEKASLISQLHTFQKQAVETEQEVEKACKQIDKSKKKQENEISTLKQFLAESRVPKEAIRPAHNVSEMAKCDGERSAKIQVVINNGESSNHSIMDKKKKVTFQN